MNGAHPGAPRSRRRSCSHLVLLLAGAATLLGACSGADTTGRFVPRADPLATQPGTLPAAAPEVSVVTLITGDRVNLARGAAGEAVISVKPGPGREDIGFYARTRDEAGGEAVTVIPRDALALVGAGLLDPALFDVSGLIRQGYDDENAPGLPVIVTGAGSMPAALAASGAQPIRRLESIGGDAAVADKQEVGGFWRWITDTLPASALPGALPAAPIRVWLDTRATLLLDQSAALIGAPEVWSAGLTGLGVTVAVLDTGIAADHPDLAGKVIEAVDFTGTRPDASDNVGHGTHVAGIVAGTGAASGGRYRGIAPDASLIVGKVCSNQSCTASAIIAGMEWAAPRARIVNLSLGSGPTDGTDPLSQAVDALTAQHGTLFVAAAGNSGAAQTVGAPAAADAALAVASIDKNGAPSAFSSRGPRLGDQAVKPDLTAPGGAIVAARARGTPNGDSAPIGDSYVRLSGTSMASPHVAGSAALLAQQHPDWKAAELKAALLSAARPVEGAHVVATGVGRVDLVRATSQRVTASGSVSFGLLPWPHNAPSLTRTITYRNQGDSAVTLDLTLAASAADGLPAPAGLFAANPPRVTVPAGGTADVALTVTPQARRAGLYGLIVSASDGTNRVVSAATVYQEPEQYDLTIQAIDRNGEPPSWAFGFVIETATGQSYSVNHPAGPIKLRLPRGQYDISTFLTGVEGDIAATRPQVDLDGDTEVTLDGRLSKTLGVTVDRPDAALTWWSVSLHARASNGRGVTTVKLSDTPVHALPTEPVTGPAGHVFALNFRAYLFPAPRPDGQPAAEDYIYNLVFPLHGGVPEELSFRVEDRELGKVHARYHAQGEATAYRSSAGSTPDGASSFIPIWDQPLPGRRLEYYSAGPRWEEALQLHPKGAPTIFGERTLGNTIYQAGEERWVRWFSAPIGPSFGPAAPFWGAYRINDEISVFLTPFSPAEPEHVTLSLRGTTTLSRDGVVIGTSANAAYGRFRAPHEPGTYTLEASGTREVSWSTLGTAFSGTWTFQSAPAGDEGLHRLPLLLVHVAGPVDSHNSAPAGRPYLLSLEAQRQPGAPTAAVTALTLEVSFDDGQTWEPAPVAVAGERGVALVHHPEAPGFVSLRASARDAAGNTVTHAVTRAYRTHAVP